MTAAATYGGNNKQWRTTFWVYMAGFFVILFCMGFIFGNINALVMEWLGGMAGLGNSIVGSLSSLVPVIVAIVAGRFTPIISIWWRQPHDSRGHLAVLIVFARRAPGET